MSTFGLMIKIFELAYACMSGVWNLRTTHIDQFLLLFFVNGASYNLSDRLISLTFKIKTTNLLFARNWEVPMNGIEPIQNIGDIGKFKQNWRFHINLIYFRLIAQGGVHRNICLFHSYKTRLSILSTYQWIHVNSQRGVTAKCQTKR